MELRTTCLVLAAGLLPLLARGVPEDAQAKGGPDGALTRFEHRRIVMGTMAHVVVYAPSEEAARDGAAAAFARMEMLDRELSDYDGASELSRLSAAAGRGPVEVGADLFGALAQAQAVAQASGGAFDPTIGPLTHLWRTARAEQRLPAPAELSAARALVSWQGLALDPETRTAALADPGMELDLGGIGKGLACREALAVLREHGLGRALVELGGDLVVGDAPPERAAWRIALECGGAREAGDAGDAPPERVIELVDAGVATSGDSEQHLDAGGERYSHVLDPRTGLGLTTRLCASVVAPDGALADALASAALVVGPDEARALVARFAGARITTEDERFTPLFDGRTLGGWTTVGGRYDGHASWSVEDGCIVGRSGPNAAGGLLYTEKPYTSFELELEVQVEHPFDSGVFVRMAPKGKGAQVTLDDRPDGEIAAIYSDGWLQENPHGIDLWKAGEWNRLRVRCTGFDMHLEVWLNGTETMDYRVPAGTPGFAPTGLIGLQVHEGGAAGGSVRFRNLRVRELPLFGEICAPVADEPGLLQPAEAAKAAGWTALLAQDSLDGWEAEGDRDGYRVADGVLAIPSRGGGYLCTKTDFRDFRLRLDFETERMANSGVFLRGLRGGGDPAYSGCEIQVLDDFDWEEETKTTLKPWQLTGSLYGAVPAGAPGTLHPIGEWNTYEILYQGSRLAVALNGRTLYDVDTHALDAKPPFAERAPQGFLGLQRYGAPLVQGDVAVRFRNVFVQRLGE